MDNETVQMVYKEIQKRIEEGKLVITGPIKDGDFHYYTAIICMK